MSHHEGACELTSGDARTVEVSPEHAARQVPGKECSWRVIVSQRVHCNVGNTLKENHLLGGAEAR